MKVTKFIHACLLIEERDLKVLIDPGEYSFSEKALEVDKLPVLDYILITHEHADHMSISGIKQILQEFPKVKIITNPSAGGILKEQGIEVSQELPDFIKIKEVPHEEIPFGVVPENFQFDLFNKLTDPGDSHSFTESQDILALPVQAPWGSTTQAVAASLKVKPKVILPIHDWHWNEEAREGMYKRLEIFFKDQGIRFIPLTTGEPVEI